MIQVSGLTKVYGPISAIQDVTFEVEKGQIVGFLGPNGAGKSTTMRILTGFTPVTRGIAKVAGFHVEDSPLEVKRRVGYMPENVPLYGEMVVSSFLRYVAEVKGVRRSARRAEVSRVMEHCGLSDMGSRVIRNLSKGYRQRLGLAQALVGDPPVLILDEPTAGLDPKQIVEIRQLIKDLAPDHTILLSTHILPEVSMVCERVIIIHQGRIVAQDTMQNLVGGEAAELEVEALGSTDAVLTALRAVQGVAGATSLGSGRYVVKVECRVDVREAVACALSGGACRLVGIQKRGRTLEDVFVAAVGSDRGPAE
ncbi:MAG: multidrug ABC transporter ATP-binding protein [Candidatus Hydrogenedentota bacterium]